MLYDISLDITYEYDTPSDGGRHVLRMMPKEMPGIQRVVAATLAIVPQPLEWLNRTDFFGNSFVEIIFGDTQTDISFAVKARVERLVSAPPADRSGTLSQLAAEIAATVVLDAESPHHFLGPSGRISLHPEMTDYAKACVHDGMTVLQIAEALGLALHRDMRFDPEATTVDTPAIAAFRERHGVCQDFTHIMIAALRGIGVPAGYVSGFLRTNPPEGEARLEGADAMHAWVHIWCGAETGWIEYDPTNGIYAVHDHIVIARGRDYSDVSPVKGLTRTSGAQTSEQKVTVTPLP